MHLYADMHLFYNINLHLFYIVCFCFIPAVLSNESVTEKWNIVDALLHALLQAGVCYARSGDVREAKSYLSQGLQFSKAFGLTKRFLTTLFCLSLVESNDKLRSLFIKITSSRN